MKILYKITFEPICWLLSISPKFIIYGISDVIYFLVYYVVGYRKKVAYANIKNSFPEKSEDEIKRIQRRFFRHLCDTIVETAAFIKINEKRSRKFYRIKDTDVFDDPLNNGKRTVTLYAHYSNWEIMMFLPLHTQNNIIGVYKPLSNKYFDEVFLRMRSKFGVNVIPMDDTLRTVLTYHKNGTPGAFGLIADQRPMKRNIKYWTTFMNQETPMYLGPEKISRKINAPIIYVKIETVKRGLYEASFVKLMDESTDAPPYAVTQSYISALEEQIKNKPEYYLWTHKRWKYKREDIEKK